MRFDNDRIRQLREQGGHSQRKFADMLGVKRESVIQWEQGKCSPRVEVVGKICSVFGVEPEYFFVENTACTQANEEAGQ